MNDWDALSTLINSDSVGEEIKAYGISQSSDMLLSKIESVDSLEDFEVISKAVEIVPKKEFEQTLNDTLKFTKNSALSQKIYDSGAPFGTTNESAKASRAESYVGYAVYRDGVGVAESNLDWHAAILNVSKPKSTSNQAVIHTPGRGYVQAASWKSFEEDNNYQGTYCPKIFRQVIRASYRVQLKHWQTTQSHTPS